MRRILLLAGVLGLVLFSGCDAPAVQEGQDKLRSVATQVSASLTAAAEKDWHWPMNGAFEQGFRPGVGDHIGRDLYAIDVKSSDDARVFPARSGWIAFAGTNCDRKPGQPYCYGNFVAIDHGDGTYSIYTHLADPPPSLKAGQRVERSSSIGMMGETGCSGCGSHLHFVVRAGEPGIRTAAVLFESANQAVDVRGKLLPH